MLRVLAVAVAALSTASLAATVTSAQVTTPTAQPKLGQKSNRVEQKVEGTIKSVRGNLVTLEDGTEISVPSSVNVANDQLRPGAQISAEYQKRAGQKVATSVQIN